MTSASQIGCNRVRSSLGLPTVRAVLERNGTSGTANSSPHAYEVGVLCPLDFPNMRERLCVCFLCFVHGNSGKPEEVRIEYQVDLTAPGGAGIRSRYSGRLNTLQSPTASTQWGEVGGENGTTVAKRDHRSFWGNTDARVC